MKKPPLPPQFPLSRKLSRNTNEIYAEALRQTERELREFQSALGRDDSDENRSRYSKALLTYGRLQHAFPFIAAVGSGSAEA